MNLILFDSADEARHLAPGDPRLRHLREVLRLRPGQVCHVGILDGPRGKATLERDDPVNGMSFSLQWEPDQPPDFPLRLLLGLPRPQTARHLLRELTSLGARELSFFTADRGEPGYATSSLWLSDEWKRWRRQGAEQAYTTRLPPVNHSASLEAAIAAIPDHAVRLALDPYEPARPLREALGRDSPNPEADHRAAPTSFLHASAGPPKDSLDRAGRDPDTTGETDDETPPPPLTLAIGPERGWSQPERDTLRQAGFSLAHLGPRILRMETACIVAFAQIAAARGWFDPKHLAPGT